MTNPEQAAARNDRADARAAARSAADAQVQALAEANARSNDTLLKLVERVQQDAHMREKKVDLLDAGLRQTRRIAILLTVVLIMLLGIAVINAINIGAARKNAEVTAATAKDAKNTYALLLDCLNPGGECGKRGAAQQKAIVDEIKTYQLTIQYCVRTNPLLEDPEGTKFMACVNRLYPGGPQIKDR